MSADVRPQDRVKVLGALERAPRLTRSEVRNLFGRHRTPEELDTLAASLEVDGYIMRIRIEPGGGNDRKPTEVWERIKAQSPVSVNGSATPVRDSAEVIEDISEGVHDGPPPGEGWLPKTATLRKAYRGVVPAVAARAGRLARQKDRAEHGGKTKLPRVSDEQRGATKLVGAALYNYRQQGIIEVQGDWIRLVKNPTRRPPRHWYEALLQFVAEGHPTLDGKWRRPPKPTLKGRMEDALGRKLEPHERVMRFPGCAGSWDPADILLFNRDTRAIVTLADIRERPGR